MSVLNPNSEEEAQECPLCLELLELDDINFYPCSCGYQICRFCWNKIRTEGSGLCPACRSPYAENPADFKPLTAEELAKIKAEKRQKDQAKKQKISENRKHLANVRVVQKNLVFVVGLSPRLAEQEVLKKPEYFGKFGKIHKVVINHSTAYAGNQNQGPSASAYVTYYKSEDALRAIQAVNNIHIDGRTLKASLGTTKYCSHFMKNQSCPKHDCMYLHELGDEAASFTKEEMQQGRHTDYERRLHDEMVAVTSQSPQQISSESNDTTDKALKTNNIENEERRSRSNSPKDNWPNLEREGNNFLERNGLVTDDKKAEMLANEKNLERLSPNESSQQSIENSSDYNESKRWSLPSTSTDSPTPPTAPHQEIATVTTSSATSVATKSTTDFFGEDDLGFDPFHETQKALAEMLETETQQQQQQQLHQQLHTPPVDLSNMGLHYSSVGGGNRKSGGVLNSNSPPPFLQQQRQQQSRPKAPPPGFNLNPNMHSNMGQRFGGLENLPNHMQQVSPGFSSPEFLLSNSLEKSLHQGMRHQPNFPSASLGNGIGGGSNSNNWHGKDSQDGFRALFPNVNVSFGNVGGGGFSNTENGANRHQQNMNLLHHQRNGPHFHRDEMVEQNGGALRQKEASGWNHDWTILDPAIVGGQLSNSRGDSPPPNWIKSNLEQLTSEVPPSLHHHQNHHQVKQQHQQLNHILPGFSSLSLSNNSNGQRGGAGVNWMSGALGGSASGLGGGPLIGGPPANGAGSNAAPPPGFGMGNRGQMQHSFQNISSLNTNSDGHQIEI